MILENLRCHYCQLCLIKFAKETRIRRWQKPMFCKMLFLRIRHTASFCFFCYFLFVLLCTNGFIWRIYIVCIVFWLHVLIWTIICRPAVHKHVKLFWINYRKMKLPPGNLRRSTRFWTCKIFEDEVSVGLYLVQRSYLGSYCAVLVLSIHRSLYRQSVQ